MILAADCVVAPFYGAQCCLIARVQPWWVCMACISRAGLARELFAVVGACFRNVFVHQVLQVDGAEVAEDDAETLDSGKLSVE